METLRACVRSCSIEITINLRDATLNDDGNWNEGVVSTLSNFYTTELNAIFLCGLFLRYARFMKYKLSIKGIVYYPRR